MSNLLPTHCFACKTKLQWTETRTDIFCPNENCIGANLPKIVHFFKVLSADQLAEGTITNLIDAGLNTIPKILKADKKQLAKVEGFADKSTQNVLLSIQKLSKNINLPKLMHASGLFATQSTGLGSSLLANIVDKLGTKVVLEDEIKVSKLRRILVNVDKIGEDRADLFLDNLEDFRKFYRSLDGISIASTKGKLTGKIFSFTGFRDIELQTLIEQNGGRVAGMSKNVCILFAAAPSLKTEKADKYKVEVVLQPKARARIEQMLK